MKKNNGPSNPKVVINKNEDNPEPAELIASSIIEIAAAFKKFQQSKLRERVILLLIKDASGIPIGTIQKVLNAAANLEKDCIKAAK